MDTKFQTSFIPKQALTKGVSHTRPESISVFLLISIIVFILSLSALGGLYAYKKVLVNRINEMNNRLVQAKNSFEPDFIEKLSRLNKRIESANIIVASHTALTPIFSLLENITLATVKFDTFTYEFKDNGASSLFMTGQAKNFSSVALQSDIFGYEKYIKNPVFSDLNPDQSGNIVFKFSSTVDPALISYKNIPSLNDNENNL
ncbi:MAG: hypothetical protein UW34_C0007G0008 [Parcubacteria group bacterium GW2011_GWA2_44_15]|nr:MAG: hypothetical protein UW34_C0007G0008 [Parcubacteria group bacterium GW2011_GWA2_44_15]